MTKVEKYIKIYYTYKRNRKKFFAKVIYVIMIILDIVLSGQIKIKKVFIR